MNGKFAVIGLGQFGMSIARTLADRGAEVIAIDHDLQKVEQIKDEVAYAVALDATDLKALAAQDVNQVEAAVVAIGEDFEALLLATSHVMELKVKRVIARAATPQQRMILEKIGVTEILSPEETVGKTVAETLLHPNLRSYFDLPDNYEIVEIKTPKRVVNQSLSDIGLRESYDLNLITIKRTFEEQKKNGETIQAQHVIGVPRADTVLYENDLLIVMGKTEDINKFIECSQ